MCLLLIGAQPGILASQIAEVLHLHRGTLSGILRRLERGGFITREVDASDARRAGLTLTPEGARLRGQRTGTFEKAVRRVVSNVSDADRRAAEKVLIGLRRELELVG
jgi:DNA-binding MarR family transcriptional regulator